MKTRGFLFSLLFTTSFLIGYSQDLELEVLAGPSLTDIRGSELMDRYLGTARVRFSTGIGLNVRLWKQSYLLTGLLYEQKGSSGEQEFRDDEFKLVGSANLYMNYNYITLPVQWAVRVGKKVRYQFGVGAYTSYLLKQNYVYDASSIVLEAKTVIDRTDFNNKLDVGVALSAAAYIPLSERFSLKVSADEHYGLINASKPNEEPVKHQSLALTVGLNVKLK